MYYKVRWLLQNVTVHDDLTLLYRSLDLPTSLLLSEEVARTSEREESREKSTSKSPPDGRPNDPTKTNIQKI